MKLETLEKSNVQFAILLILLAFYLLTKNIIFSVAIALFVIFVVAFEFYVGIKKHGWNYEIIDTLLTIIGALILWFGFQYVMHSPTPISAIVSCSMVPSLNRGDLVLVKGEDFYNITSIHVNSQDVNALYSDITHFYRKDNNTYKEFFSTRGSILSFCQATLEDFCVDFSKHPDEFYETKGNFTFYYGNCVRKLQNGERLEPCLVKIGYKDKNFTINKNNDVLVYRPTSNDLFSLFGDIVHRGYLKLIDENGNVYFLTKGDNNNVLDIQFYSYKYGMGNHPINKKNVLGKVIFRIPYLGYYKLFLSFYFKEDSLCNTRLIT